MKEATARLSHIKSETMKKLHRNWTKLLAVGLIAISGYAAYSIGSQSSSSTSVLIIDESCNVPGPGYNPDTRHIIDPKGGKIDPHHFINDRPIPADKDRIMYIWNASTNSFTVSCYKYEQGTPGQPFPYNK